MSGPQMLAPPPPLCGPPPLTPARLDELSAGKLVLTQLHGATVHAFDIGGELRLCLPQVLQRVLLCNGLGISNVSAACDAMGISCSRCNSAQLHALRVAFGHSLDTCGLITKSDAERLCKRLLDTLEPKYTRPIGQHEAVPVLHLCFGKQRGRLLPQLYASPAAACIVCTGCCALLSPHQFVGHCHTAPERATCHWGFDSQKWRRYLLLDRRQQWPGCEEALEAVKQMFLNEDTWADLPLPKRQRVERSELGQQPQQQQALMPPMLSHSHYAPNIRLSVSDSNKEQLRKVSSVCGRISDTELQACIVSGWESLTDWCEGHLPEKATPQFLEMVEQLKAVYRCRASSLLSSIASLQAELSSCRDAQTEAEQLHWAAAQQQQQLQPEMQKVQMQCLAQMDEIQILRSQLRHMQVQLAAQSRLAQLPPRI